MTKTHELEKDAHRAYRQFRVQDAALLWLQASEQSRELGNVADWYKFQVWAAEAFTVAQQYAKAMDLLLEVRMYEPPDRPNFEAWLAHKALFALVAATNPQIKRLQGYLNELRQLATQQTVPAGDMPELEGDVLFDQGKFSEARAAYEKAWVVYDDKGYVKYGKAFNAAKCCLQLGQIKPAKDWHDAGFGTQENYQTRLIDAAELELRIALAEPDWAALITLLSKLDDTCAGIQGDGSKNAVNQLSARVHLLYQTELDPMQPSHPAQQSLLRPLLDRKNVHTQFDYRLLMLDFRVAALRFIVGIPPVDDLYCVQPQAMPAKQRATLNKKQYQRGLQRALASCKQAERYGRRIDDLLQCDYRQQEVAKRLKRIQEISEYVSIAQEKANGS